MNLCDLGDLDQYGWVHALVDDRPAVRAHDIGDFQGRPHEKPV